MNMFLDNRMNPTEFQGHRLQVKVTWFVFLVCMMLRVLADSI